MIKKSEVELLIKYCESHLDLSKAELSPEYFYHSLPFCVIDSIFSIGAKYSATRNTVIKYCAKFDLVRLRDGPSYPEANAQQSVSEAIQNFDDYGIDRMAVEVLENRQRTSTKNGILKSEASHNFLQALKNFGVDDFQDFADCDVVDLEKSVTNITGQKSGISFSYFLMLAGSDDHIKPDRMIHRFLSNVIGRKIFTHEEARDLLLHATEELKYSYKDLTPRLLDHTIWNYERSKPKAS